MRTFQYDILEVIKKRWSSRALSEKEVSRDDVYALIEAASYAPSAMNEQPWRFIVGHQSETLNKLRNALTLNNQEWANRAPVLLCLLSNKFHTKNNKENKFHLFDSASAFAFLTLEATKRGLIAHGMGGFDQEVIKSSFNISDDYDVVLMIAIGYPGDKSQLSERNQERENPGLRKSISEIIIQE